MESLIETVNRLQEVFASTKIGDLHAEIQLPQIVVIGAQSVGKSSVLEGFVGRDFLPRGTGIVTRRPLVLHLNYCAKDSPVRVNHGLAEDVDWAVFGHAPGHIFTIFEEIRQEIEADTERVAGSNKGIFPDPIMLTIYSHRVVKLSLVDLPGITKVPVGDQPYDIEEQIRDMLFTYIKNPNSLILAVTPANQDFATSEALKMAKEVDETGDRTVAVITKLDLMDHGTNALDVLNGIVIPVKRGIVGVVNRSQADINEKKGMESCCKDEMEFLKKTYPSIAKSNGIKYLASELSRMLMEHIYTCLPMLRERIEEKIQKCKVEAKALGDPVKDQHFMFISLINRFVAAYKETIMGTIQGGTSLIGGAKISYIFHQKFFTALENIDPVENLTDVTIHHAILNSSGLKPTLLVPEHCFEQLVKKEIKRLKEPSLDCVKQVNDEMLKAIEYCTDDENQIQKELNRFPILKAKMHKVISAMLEERLHETNEVVENGIGFHECYINTKHPDFDAKLLKMLKNWNAKALDGSKKAKIENDSDSEFDDDDDEPLPMLFSGLVQMSYLDRKNCRLMKSLIKQYFKIVRKIVQDLVPKAIMFCMIKYVDDNLVNKLFIQLHRQDEINTCLEESVVIAQRRAECIERLETLKKANDILSEINYYA